MTVFENPFHILGAAMTDDRRTLRSLCDEKRLLTASCDEAFQVLTTPSQRIHAELRWFPSMNKPNIQFVLSFLSRSINVGKATMSSILKPAVPLVSLATINQITTLLPFFSDEILDAAIFEASRAFDSIDHAVLLHTLNSSRTSAEFPLLQSPDLDVAVDEYLDEIHDAFADRIQRLRAPEYDLLISRIARFGSSQIIEALMRDYDLKSAQEFDRCEETILDCNTRLKRFLCKEERQEISNKICLTVQRWSVKIAPLQQYAGSLGSEKITADREIRMIRLLNESSNQLASFGEESCEQAVDVTKALLSIIPTSETYASTRKTVSGRLISLENAADTKRRKELEQYKQMSECAWQQEQERGDEDSKQRAEEAARQERERNERLRQRRATANKEKEQVYSHAIDLYNTAKTVKQFAEAFNLFDSISGWEDADAYAEKCKQRITEIGEEKAYTALRRKERKKIAFLIIIPVLCAIIALVTALGLWPKQIFPEAPHPVSVSEGLIKTPYDTCDAPVTVEAPSGSSCYVYFKNTESAWNDFSLFVKAGSSVKVDAPLGNYKLYFATGTTWYGTELKFGKNTNYFTSPDLFKFYISGDYVYGATIKLYTVYNGNMATNSISESEFPD